MTRVEKYREYRKEILNSFYFDKKESKKSITSSKVSSATMNTDTGNSLSYEDVLNAYEIYEEEHPSKPTKRKMNAFEKKQLIFILVGSGVALLLIVALFIVGIYAFGGN